MLTAESLITAPAIAMDRPTCARFQTAMGLPPVDAQLWAFWAFHRLLWRSWQAPSFLPAPDLTGFHLKAATMGKGSQAQPFKRSNSFETTPFTRCIRSCSAIRTEAVKMLSVFTFMLQSFGMRDADEISNADFNGLIPLSPRPSLPSYVDTTTEVHVQTETCAFQLKTKRNAPYQQCG